MKLCAIIVAGGSGTRMGTEIPKQFLPLHDGRPMLMHTVEKFYNIADQIIIALPKAHITLWVELCCLHKFDQGKHNIVIGGDQRYYSVKNALQNVDPTTTLVAVHDAVRPYISTQLIHKVANAATQNGAAIPAINVSDTIRQIQPDGKSITLVRNDLRAVQTPQIFSYKLITEAYKQPFSTEFTDDASVVEAMGTKVALCEGEPKNIKITYPNELKF